MAPAPTEKKNVVWADGLRGVASVLVVTAHICRSLAPHLLSPSMSDKLPPMLFQLPFVRCLVMGRASVAAFALLAGYLNSLKPIKQTRAGNIEAALTGIARSSFRRTGRFVLPAVIATTLSWFVCQLGAYRVANLADSAWIRDTSPEPSSSFVSAFYDLFANLGATWIDGFNEYDKIQWTLTYLLKGSMMTYLTLIALIYVKPRWRIVILMGLYYFMWKCGDALVGFNVFWGILLAELSLDPKVQEWISEHPYTRSISSATLIILGLYFCSYPEENPSWSSWSRNLDKLGEIIFPKDVEYSRYYPGLGVDVLTAGVMFNDTAKKVLSHSSLQWMGKVSFAIYLLHAPLIRTVLTWVLFGFSVQPDHGQDKDGNQLPLDWLPIANRWPSLLVKDASSAEMEDKKEPLMLLDLPAEILQTVAWHMDPGTFFVSLLTCKTIYDAAKYRRNLLRHLHSIPGLRLGLEDLTTSDLLLRFRKRAAASLCGGGILADITRYAPVDSVKSISKAIFSSGAPAQLATVHEPAIVNIYELTADHVRLKAELRIQSREDSSDLEVEVLKIAFSSTRDLAILYGHKRSPRKVSPFVDDEATETKRTLKMVTFHHCYSGMRGHFYSTDEQETTDITQDLGFEPAGLALASNGNFCISWACSDIEKHPEVWLCGRDKKLMAALQHDASPRKVVFREPSTSYSNKPDRLIFNLQFVRDNKTINFYQPGDPVHRWYTNSCDPDASESGPMWKNRVHLDLENEEKWQEFHVGMPFHGVHTISVFVSHQTIPLCATSFLAIGIHHDFDPYNSDSYNAFIVHAESHNPSTSCAHRVDLESGRRNGSWKALALLAGWRRGTSSLGTVMAISPGGGSIASATWSRVLVWTINPRLLHQGELQHYFPVHDYNHKRGIGRLRPFLLKPMGVVHNMLWISETVLYATTDHGLVKWDMGNMSNGEKEDLSLAFDAWPETAVAMPLTG